VELSQKWQTFRFGFVARADEDNARLSFSFGGRNVPVYLANVEFRPGGRVSLQGGESIRANSVAVFADNESPARTLDRIQFLAETEKAYFDGMRNFIKKDLGCKALVTGTIVFGPLGLYAQSDMDFIDAHAYWQHPRFPGRPWDSGNWIVEQKPMTDHPDEATLFQLAAKRLLGKPFTVSEYNHPAPLDSQAACVPMIASFAAAQDWDGVWLYTYSHGTDDWYRENMNGYFDIDTNPAKWGFMRAGAAIFREAAVTPVKRRTVAVLSSSSNLLPRLAQLHLAHDRDMFDVVSETCDAVLWIPYGEHQTVLSNRLYVSFQPASGLEQTGRSSTQLRWSVENGKGFYSVIGGAAILAGHTARFGQATGQMIIVTSPDFVALTLTALENGTSLNDSRRILITACGRCENVGMKFSEDRHTVGRNWGEAPVQIEAVDGTIEIPSGNWRCQAIGPDGLAKADVPVRSEGGRNYIDLSSQYKTMWYLLTRISKQE